MRVVALLVALVASLLVAAPADAAGVTTTWPNQTRFNPQDTPYTFHIDDSDGSGLLYAVWTPYSYEDAWTPIPHHGDVTMPFDHDGQGVIKVWRCQSEQGPCSQEDTSPQLTEFQHLHPFPVPINTWPVVG